MYRIKKAAAAIYGWDRPLLTRVLSPWLISMGCVVKICWGALCPQAKSCRNQCLLPLCEMRAGSNTDRSFSTYGTSKFFGPFQHLPTVAKRSCDPRVRGQSSGSGSFLALALPFAILFTGKIATKPWLSPEKETSLRSKLPLQPGLRSKTNLGVPSPFFPRIPSSQETMQKPRITSTPRFTSTPFWVTTKMPRDTLFTSEPLSLRTNACGSNPCRARPKARIPRRGRRECLRPKRRLATETKRSPAKKTCVHMYVCVYIYMYMYHLYIYIHAYIYI